MKFLRVASDIHLEWIRDKSKHPKVLPEDELDKESILILAGDIGNGLPVFNFVKSMADRFPHVVYVPGNHEYYGSLGYEQWNETAYERLKNISNLTFTPGTVERVVIDDNIKIIATTLWADCEGEDPISMIRVQNGMSDFRAIPNFNVEKMIGIHKRSRAKVKELLLVDELPTTRKIVVTHHTPSHTLAHGNFIGDPVNGGFHSNCDDLFGNDWSPDVWIFGHTHDRVTKMLGDTLVFNNPKGYPNEPSGVNFNSRLFLDMRVKGNPLLI